MALPEQVLILHGVPRGMPGAPAGIRAGMVLAILCAGFLPQVMVAIAAPRYGFYAVMAAFVGVAVAVFAFVYFTRHQSSASARISVSRLGIGLQPLKPVEGAAGRVFIPWVGDEVYRVIRVGSFWRKLIIRRRDGKAVIEIGFRCPDSMHNTLAEGFAAAFPRETPDTPPTTPVPLSPHNDASDSTHRK